MPSVVKHSYEFDDFRLDAQNRVLWREVEPVPLTPKAFEMLSVMVQNRGKVVTKGELMHAVWPDTFVEESNLTQTVFMLRKALGETSEKRYILTVPGRGYRFAPEVNEVPQNGHLGAVAPSASSGPATESGAPPATQSDRGWSKKSSVVLAASVGMVLLAVSVGYVRWSAPRNPAHQLHERPMLAVLPFENLTGDAGQEYFSDGMTEEIISQLSNLDPQHLGVIARTSVMHYKKGQPPLDQIGRELGVQYVLEGSVRRDSNEVRITAQLIQMKDQTHLWARQYDRELKGLLVVQGEIAQQIAEEIQSALGDKRKRKDKDDKQTAATRQSALSPQALDAYDLYLKGQYFWNKRTPESLPKGIEYFQQAIDKDPTYARAYAGLADCYALITGYDPSVPANEAMPKARAAAARAVELDEGLAEAHTALALVAQDFDWDWPTAEREYQRAIELNPNYATAHHWYGEYLGLMGRFDEAFREFERARQLDPLSLIIATDNAVTLLYSRQYDRAISQFRAVQEMDPDFPHAHMVIVAYVQKGLYADALAHIETWQRIDDSPWSWSMLAYVYGRSGQSLQARGALERLRQWNRRKHLSAGTIFLAYAGMGNKDEAFAWLNQAIAEHSVDLSLKVNPVYDPLRGDPRFHELMRQVRLAQ